MSAAPVTETAAPVTETAIRRRIGDILLEHGFASEAELAEAVAEQERTGQPLGQILVQQGVITRLELASALAEQWSDQSLSISLLPVPKPATKPVAQHNDDDQYAARLQDAVADLARRVHATPPSDGADERLTDLAERIEATVARTQRIEATLATLADSLEGVTGGVEEAFAGLQGGMATIALDLARIDSTVVELMARPPEPAAADPDLTERLEELSAAVQSLGLRPVVDDELRSRVDEIAARLEQLAEPGSLDHLDEALGDVRARVEALAGESVTSAELERQAAFLADLRTTVAALESRPVGSPEIDARLERIEAGLTERSATDEAAASIEALAARVEATAGRQEEMTASVDALGDRMEALVALSERDRGTVARIDELATRLVAESEALAELRQALEGRPEPASARKLEKLSAALDRLRVEVASLGQTTTGPRIEEVAARVEQLAADRETIAPLTARLAALETTLAADVVTSDDLTHALARARDELSRAIPEPDGRIDQLAHELQSLRSDLAHGRVGEGATQPDPRVEHLTHELQSLRDDLVRTRDELGHAAPEPDGRIDQLAHDLGFLRTELARARDELGTTTPEADARIETIVQDLASVQAETARLRSEVADAAPDPDLADRLETLTGRVTELAADHAGHAKLTSQLQDVERRLASDLVSSTAFEQAIGEIRAELARSVATPQGSRETDQAVARLEERLGALDALSARVDVLVETVMAAAPAEPAVADTELRREIEQRLDEIARALEDRVAAVATARPAETDAPAAIEEELERTRMAIERVGLHLGEHDRALSELQGSRTVTARLDELAARIDDLAEAGRSAGAAPQDPGERSYVRRSLEPDLELRSLIRRLEDVEDAAHAGREKLMHRLERMASSIDWRLQRLEAGEPE